ncbi:TolC family protein [Dokdonella sp.]|uniref:TolC family protein n=1 Tax=Dokdonella sp. TaxID=2291710 RepID=UPI0031BE3C89|nr:TolC family protein [Dokdonella sp.]
MYVFLLSAPIIDRRVRPVHRRAAALAVALACLLTGVSALAAGGSGLSFDEAVHGAAERAPLVIARHAAGVAAVEEVARADALPDPRLGFGIQSLPVGGPHAWSLTEDGMTMRQVGITQDLPSRAKRQARRESAEARVAEAEAESIATVLDVQRAAARAWIDLWAASRERELLEALREESALSLAATRARLSGGGGSASDVLAVRASDLELANRLDAAAARIEQARARLARWLGESIPPRVAEPPDFATPPAEEAVLVERLDQQGPLLAWAAREAAAEAAVELARAEKNPDWSIGGGFAKRGAGDSNVIWMEVSVALPLFPGNRQDRGISARAADLEALRARRDDARRQQVEAIRSGFATWAGYGRQVARYRDALLPLAGDRTRTALAAYSGGASLQGWLDARRDAIDTRIDYAAALAAWGEAWAGLAFLLPDPALRPSPAPLAMELSR